MIIPKQMKDAVHDQMADVVTEWLSLLVRFAYWMSRRKLGKVMTPLKVVFARIPKLLFAQWGITRVLEACAGEARAAQGAASVSPELGAAGTRATSRLDTQLSAYVSWR